MATLHQGVGFRVQGLEFIGFRSGVKGLGLRVYQGMVDSLARCDLRMQDALAWLFLLRDETLPK